MTKHDTTYTREQILKMPAGRLLDALVAEHVMQMDVVPDQLPHLPKYYLPEYDRTIFRDVPLYSSDIDDSFEVLEKFDSHQCTKMNNLVSKRDRKYRVIVKANKYAAYAETLPLAVCRASLLAVMGI